MKLTPQYFDNIKPKNITAKPFTRIYGCKMFNKLSILLR